MKFISKYEKAEIYAPAFFLLFLLMLAISILVVAVFGNKPSDSVNQTSASDSLVHPIYVENAIDIKVLSDDERKLYEGNQPSYDLYSHVVMDMVFIC